jgi:MSHA pilin protein MshD
MLKSTDARQQGFTLIEMVIAIVVLGVGLAGLLLAFSTVSRHNADPLINKQMFAVAQEIMEEIALKPYTAVANTAPASCARDTYNDISDYDGYSASQICDMEGTPIANLAAYSLDVSVAVSALDGIAEAKKITVTVGHATGNVSLVSWRTNYGGS